MRTSKNPTKPAPTKPAPKSVSKSFVPKRTGNLRVWLFLVLDYLSQHFSRINRFVLSALTVMMCVRGGFVVNFSTPVQHQNTKIDIAKFTTQSNTDDTVNTTVTVNADPVIAIDPETSPNQAVSPDPQVAGVVQDDTIANGGSDDAALAGIAPLGIMSAASCNRDGVCDAGAGESASVCFWDCWSEVIPMPNGGSPCDFDNKCDAAETQASCPFDCNIPSRGGTCHNNGVCEIKESKTCADCTGPLGAGCGNAICDEAGGENATNCPTDCCSITRPGGGGAPGRSGCEELLGAGINHGGCHYCGPNVHGPYNPGVSSMTCPYEIDLYHFTEVCEGGVDDDGNGLTDCNDTEICATDPACQGQGGSAAGGSNTAGGSTAGSSAGGATSAGSTTTGSASNGGTTAGGGSNGGGGSTGPTDPSLFSGCSAQGTPLTPLNIATKNITLVGPNGTSRPLASIFGSEYLFIDVSAPRCTNCVNFANSHNSDNAFQQRFSNSTCSFVALTAPNDLSSRTDAIGVNSFIGKRSFSTTQTLAVIEQRAGLQGIPAFLIMNRNGHIVSSAQGGTLPAYMDTLCIPCSTGGPSGGGTTGGTSGGPTGGSAGGTPTSPTTGGTTGGGGVLSPTSPTTGGTTSGGGGTAGTIHPSAPVAGCADGIKNGTETDIDCGGQCAPCIVGKLCQLNTDCTNGSFCDISSTLGTDGTSDTAFVTQSVGTVQGKKVDVINDVSTSEVMVSEQQDIEYVPGTYIVKFKTTAATPRRLLPDFDKTVETTSTYVESLQRMYNTPKTEQYDEQQQLEVQRTMIKNIVQNDVERIEKMFVSTTSEEVANTYWIQVGETSTEKVLKDLQANNQVEYIEKVPLYKIDTNDTYANPGDMRYLSKVEADKAWSAGAQGSSNVVIAVIDNAFQTSHPDLQANTLPGYDASTKDNDPSPPASRGVGMPGAHGTHTAGSAAAVTNNGQGVAAISNNVKVLPIKATSDNYPPTYVTHYIEAIEYAAQRPDVNIISMSFGGPGYSQTLQNVISSHPEKLFIAAAGNNGISSIQYPAGYNGVLSVAASTETDVKAGFSNYGSWVDVAGPGVGILSTMPGQNYAPSQGTSMATPVVASLAGLVWSVLGSSATATQVQAIIKNTADAMPTSQAFCNGWAGAGRINACKAVNAAGIPCVSSYGANNGPSSCGIQTTISCGDGVCNGTESCSTCPQDCTSCPINPPTGGENIGGSSGATKSPPTSPANPTTPTAPTTPTTPPTSPIPPGSSKTPTVPPTSPSPSPTGPDSLVGSPSTPSKGSAGSATDQQVGKGIGVCTPLSASPCNFNKVCEPTQGETVNNCFDCAATITPTPTSPTNPTTQPGGGLGGSATSSGPMGGGTTAGGGGSVTNSGSVGAGSPSITQQCPLIKAGITVSKTTMQPGDTATWTLIFGYETYAALYPTAQLILNVTLPNTLSFAANSDQPSFPNGYNGVGVAGNMLTFKVNIGDMQPIANNNSLQTIKQYQGTITFTVVANGQAAVPGGTYPVSLGCFGLSPAGASCVGTPQTCSTSPNSNDAIFQGGSVVTSGHNAPSTPNGNTPTLTGSLGSGGSVPGPTTPPSGGSTGTNTGTGTGKNTGTNTGTNQGNNTGANQGSNAGSGSTDTTCKVTGLESANCADAKDNDCDGKVDCSDIECAALDSCKNPKTGQLCGNGKQERIYGEQCDNGTKNGTNEPVGTGQVVCSTTCQIVKGVNLCGNSFLNGDEECDDGNLTDGDGCNRACAIEASRRCDKQEPSKCTDKLCKEHGEYYTSTDPYGLCCEGLSSMVIGTGTTKVMACYMPSIGIPECRIDEEEGKIGWQVRTPSNQRRFIKEDMCAGAGTLVGTGSGIYYRRIWDFLNEANLACQYTDVDYSKVDFADIQDSRQRTAILALKDACIVKGEGLSGRLFAPNRSMSRAEFIKLLVKTIYLGRGIDFQDELSIRIYKTSYADVPIGYRASAYIAEAEKMGLLSDLEGVAGGKRKLSPNKSITKNEIIRMLEKRKEGYPMTTSMMESLLGKTSLPTRAAIGDVMTRKYIDKFLPYYFLQGGNRQYFEGLLAQLLGKDKTKQRDLILQEIAKIEKADPAQFEKDYDYRAFWIITFLKGLITK